MLLAAAAKSVMSDSVRLHRRQPTRLPCPWDSPGRNTGVGCHFLLHLFVLLPLLFGSLILRYLIICTYIAVLSHCGKSILDKTYRQLKININL